MTIALIVVCIVAALAVALLTWWSVVENKLLQQTSYEREKFRGMLNEAEEEKTELNQHISELSEELKVAKAAQETLNSKLAGFTEFVSNQAAAKSLHEQIKVLEERKSELEAQNASMKVILSRIDDVKRQQSEADAHVEETQARLAVLLDDLERTRLSYEAVIEAGVKEEDEERAGKLERLDDEIWRRIVETFRLVDELDAQTGGVAKLGRAVRKAV